MYIGKQPVVGNFQVCDAISVVNGQAAYTMQVGSTNVEPENANHMLVSLNGVLQKPGSSFTISGATITFASNLATGDVIDFIILLGDVLNIGTPSDNGVVTASIAANAVTAAKLNNDIISGLTALTDSPADTDELIVSDAGTIKRVDVSLVGGKNTPAFQATMSGNQNIANGTATKVQFDTEDFDTDGKYDHSSNYRFTPTVAGKYHVTVRLTYEDASVEDKSQDAFIYKNGSQVMAHRTRTSGSTGRDKSTEVNAIVTLDTDDYIEAYTNHNIGSTKAILTGTGSSVFTAFKLIGA
jgi:hypothetical protein